jgi:hypothetical protein
MAIHLHNRTQKSKSLILALAVATGWSVSLPSLAQTPPDSGPPDKIAPPLEENDRHPLPTLA